MILKINVKQFVDTTLNTYCARIGAKVERIEIHELRKCVKPTYELNPSEEGWDLKVSSLEVAFQALALLKQGASRIICGRHEALCTLRTLKLNVQTLTLEEAFTIRDLGYNSLIAVNLDVESTKIARSAQLKVFSTETYFRATVEEINDYETTSEFLLKKLVDLEKEHKTLIFELPKELFFTADLFEVVATLSQKSSENTYIAFPIDESLFSKLEQDPYLLTKNLLPLYEDFPEQNICWERLNLLGVVGSIVNCGTIPTSELNALKFGHSQFLPSWKESTQPANI